MMLLHNDETPSPRDLGGLTLRILTFGPGGDESVYSMSDLDAELRTNEQELQAAAEADLLWHITLDGDGRLQLGGSGRKQGMAWCTPLPGASWRERAELARMEFRLWSDWMVGDTWRLTNDEGSTIYEGTHTECLKLQTSLEAPQEAPV